MKLDEILDKPLKFEVRQNEPDEYLAVFKAGDREIQFYAQNEGAMDDEDEGVWEIVFGEQTPNDLVYGKTGSGRELDVFSTLKAILQKFIKSRDPKMIRFSADKNDKNRARLYARMFQKNLPPKWRLDREDDPEDSSVFFAMVKEALDKPVEYEVTDDTRLFFDASFISGGRKIKFTAMRDLKVEGKWEISFAEIKSRESSIPGHRVEYESTKQSGSGKEFEVFATIRKILDEFISKRDPKIIEIDSFKGEPKRAKLYARALPKAFPSDWKIQRDDDHPSYTTFTLTKEMP